MSYYTSICKRCGGYCMSPDECDRNYLRTQKSKKQAVLLLMAEGYGWWIKRDGYRVLEFSQAEYAREWMRNLGYEHTDNMAGDSRAEVWTK